MKNKRGIFGTIFLAIILALAIVAGLLYLKIKYNGLEFKTGNFIVKIGYDKSTEETVKDTIPEKVDNDEINQNITNLTFEDNSEEAYENITTN